MRNWAKLNRDVVFGKAGGQVIWQPRIGCWYDDKIFAKQPLPERYQGMTIWDVHRELDCSARLYNKFNQCFKRVEHPDVRITRTQISPTDTEIIIETPVGRQTAITRMTGTARHALHVRREVECEDELKVAAWREEHTTWQWDQAHYEKSLQEVGDLGAPTVYMPRMNVQSLYIERMGVEQGIYAIYDWPETVEAFFNGLEASHDRLMDVIIKSPIDIINFGENIHAGTLSPELFLKYHLPACVRRCKKLRAAGKFTTSHWDGDCKALLQYAKDTGLDGIEAITPVPQGDVTIDEIKDALGDDLYLVDGIPAVYFDTTFSEDLLIEATEKIIRLFAPKLVLGISDEISSTGDIERIRLVGKIVDKYNADIAARQAKAGKSA